MADVVLKLVANNADYVNKMKEAQTASQKVYDTVERGSIKQRGLIEREIQMQKQLADQRNRATSNASLVRYNQLLDDSKKRLQDLEQAGLQAETSTNKLGAGFKSLALQVLTVVGVVKVFKALMESTHTSAVNFHAAIAGAKAGLDYFMKSVMTADFSNFIRGIRDAAKAGSEYSKTMATIQNIRREYSIKEADLNIKIEEQRRIFYEDDKTAMKDKIKAADEMLRLMKQKADMEIEVAKKSYYATVELAKKKNKLDEQDLKFIIENYQAVEETGKRYNYLNSVVEEYDKNIKKFGGLGPKGDETYIFSKELAANVKVNKEQINAFREEIVKLGPDAARFGEISKKFESVTDKERQAIVDWILAIKSGENQYNVESKRVFRMQQNMIDQYNKQVEEQKKKHLKDGMLAGIFPFPTDIEMELYKQKLEELQKIHEEVQKQYEKLLEHGAESVKKSGEKAAKENDAIDKDNAKRDKIDAEERVKKIQALKDGLREVSSFISGIVDNEVRAAERHRELLDTQISEAQHELDAEVELYKAGYASNVTAKEREIENLKKLREKALKEEEKAIKKQRAMEAIAQGINIFTSATNLLKEYSKIPIVGIALAAAAIAAMFTLLATVKTRAASAQYAKGGWTGDGSQRDETGEKVAGIVHEKEFVVRKGPAHKFIDVLEAINKDDRRMMLNSFTKLSPELFGGNSVNNIMVENAGPNSRLDKIKSELAQVNKNLRQKVNTGEEVIQMGSTTIVKKGNTTRTIRH